MTITLGLKLKDGKTALEATIQGTFAEVLEDYQNLTTQFPSAPAPLTTKKITDEAIAAAPAAPQPNVVNINQNAAKPNEKEMALEANKAVLRWAHRVSIGIKEFNGNSATEIAEKFNFRKPLAAMTSKESIEVIKLLKETLTGYGANNPQVAAYNRVLAVVDKLQNGSVEEWNAAKQENDLTEEVFAVLTTNKLLFDDALAYKKERQESLQIIAQAAASA